MRVVLATLGGLLLVGLLVVAGWQIGWWMKSASTNREAHIYRNSYGSQSANLDALSSKIADINRMRRDGTSAGIIQGYVDDACQVAAHLNDSTIADSGPRVAHFVQEECS